MFSPLVEDFSIKEEKEKSGMHEAGEEEEWRWERIGENKLDTRDPTDSFVGLLCHVGGGTCEDV